MDQDKWTVLSSQKVFSAFSRYSAYQMGPYDPLAYVVGRNYLKVFNMETQQFDSTILIGNPSGTQFPSSRAVNSSPALGINYPSSGFIVNTPGTDPHLYLYVINTIYKINLKTLSPTSTWTSLGVKSITQYTVESLTWPIGRDMAYITVGTSLYKFDHTTEDFILIDSIPELSVLKLQFSARAVPYRYLQISC